MWLALFGIGVIAVLIVVFVIQNWQAKKRHVKIVRKLQSVDAICKNRVETIKADFRCPTCLIPITHMEKVKGSKYFRKQPLYEAHKGTCTHCSLTLYLEIYHDEHPRFYLSSESGPLRVGCPMCGKGFRSVDTINGYDIIRCVACNYQEYRKFEWLPWVFVSWEWSHIHNYENEHQSKLAHNIITDLLSREMTEDRLLHIYSKYGSS